VNLNIGLDYGQHEDENEAAPPNARRKEVSNDTRKAIVEFLLAKSNNGGLKGHETKEVSTKFSVHIRTMQRIWNNAKHCLDQDAQIDVSSKKWKRGRKKKEVDMSKLRGLPILRRTTLKDVSKELGVSTTKLHKMKRDGAIKRVSNSLKPFLTHKNKKERLKWCISMLDPMSIPHNPIFKDLFDYLY
jgi:transposase